MINSKIQWTTDTHNFWMGCQKVSEGCKYCYMHRTLDKDGRDPSKVYRTSGNNFYRPQNDPDGKLIFTCSMSDFFIKDADKWRDDAWSVIKNSPQHIWQILTKRPERIVQCLPVDWGAGYKNVWLGVTVENQKTFHRVETLSNIPAKLRFISAEPLLEEVNFLQLSTDGSQPIKKIDWVIIGGESGFATGKYRYRPTEVKWMERAVNDIKSNTSASIFVKQMGTHLAKKGIGSSVERNGWLSNWHGDDFDRFPSSLKLQEMP